MFRGGGCGSVKKKMKSITASNNPESSASFVWLGAGGRERNRFVLFRRNVFIDEVPASVDLHLFADSRYRLRVNGRFVYAGPPRFVTQYPEYDTVDLLPHLKLGPNCITVEVNTYGAASYQTMPDGRGGFLAWGTVGQAGKALEIDLATPGGWLAREVEAWDAHSPLYSFAQNPVEILDTQKFNEAWVLPGSWDFRGWLPVDIIPACEAPWGRLSASTAPVIPYSPVSPETILCSAELDASELRWGFTIPDQVMGTSKTAPQELYTAFSSWIYAATGQAVVAGLHWGDFALNGTALETVPHPILGNRHDATLNLKTGWNHLTGVVEFLTAAEFWSFLIGLPKAAHLELRARADELETAAFMLSPLVSRNAIDLTWSTDPCSLPPEGWRQVVGDPLLVCPARLTAWDRPLGGAIHDRSYADLASVADIRGAGHVWVFKFKGGALGHVTLDLDAPAGTVVDVGFDDWLRPDGLIDLYRSNPFINSVERVILKGGRQQVQLFHSRGGTFIQVTVRLPVTGAHPGKARLHGVAVLQTKTIPVVLGDFHASDSAFDAIWRAAVETLSASTEDSYADSPWRERGTYLGDSYVNMLLHPLLHHDLTLARRVVRLFAQTVTVDGQMLGAVPSCLAFSHEDFTLIWVLLLHTYWSVTGDKALVEELWPAVQSVLAGRKFAVHSSGLWNADRCRQFIDWGVVKEEREGAANAVLNAFRIGALDGAAELAKVIDRDDDGVLLHSEGQALRQAYSETLWLQDTGRFAAGLAPDGPMRSTAFHANILAYLFRIGTLEQQEQVERYVIGRAKVNYELGLAGGGGAGHAELYFLAYLLPALGEHGQFDLGESLIKEHLGTIIKTGYSTLPECFSTPSRRNGSWCHSWSGYPAVYLTRYMLGLRQTTKGNPDHFILQPLVSGHITQASGRVPHAKGLINVAWTRTGAGLVFKVDAPEGVVLEVAK